MLFWKPVDQSNDFKGPSHSDPVNLLKQASGSVSVKKH